jgi:hypothetical protein
MGRRQRLENKVRRRRIPREREGAEGRDAVAKCWKVWIPRRSDNRRGFALFSGVAFLSMILLPLSSPSTATSGKLLQHGIQQVSVQIADLPSNIPPKSLLHARAEGEVWHLLEQTPAPRLYNSQLFV